ncbi:MAG: hypothetical protein ACC646_10940 [Paracoccaceae bacterium]
MSTQEIHQQAFHNRIKRIAAGGPNTMAQVYIGPARTTPQKSEQEQPGLISDLMMLPSAFLIGGSAMFLGRLAAFHLFSKDGTWAITLSGPNGILAANIIIGIVLALLLGRLFRVDKGLRFLALAGGALAFMWYDANLIAAYPDLFAIMFSQDYVIQFLGLGEQVIPAQA